MTMIPEAVIVLEAAVVVVVVVAVVIIMLVVMVRAAAAGVTHQQTYWKASQCAGGVLCNHISSTPCVQKVLHLCPYV